MAEIISAEIKYIYKKNCDTKAIYKVTYDDDSVRTGEGIQAVSEADNFIRTLNAETI